MKGASVSVAGCCASGRALAIRRTSLLGGARRSRLQQQSLTCFAILGVVTALLVSCAPPPPYPPQCTGNVPSPGALIALNGRPTLGAKTCGPLTFSYPRSWYQTGASVSGNITNLVVAVSNQPLHDPCTQSSGSFTCGDALDTLEAGAVEVEWYESEFPGPTFDIQEHPGSATTIDGFQARIQEESGSALGCDSTLKADVSISAVIAPFMPSNSYYTFYACIRGPQLQLEKQTAMLILDSAVFAVKVHPDVSANGQKMSVGSGMD